MENFRKINEHISISGQPSAADLDSLVTQGFRTVINLRTGDEDGVLPDEEREVESRALNYAAIPVSPATLDDLSVAGFSQALESEDGTPALIHCKGGGRAGIMTLLHLAVSSGWNMQETLQVGHEIGDIAPKDDSPYRAFFEDYLHRHSAGERN